jgi:hypothetical protein
MIEAIKASLGNQKNAGHANLAISTLATRMFNNFEGVKHLLLWGLPAQAQPITRDIIECMLLFRLFLVKPKSAEKWLIDLTEYQPGDAYAKLTSWGINAQEYAIYGLLSHESHSNLLASLSHVQEIDVGGKGTLHIFHLGSARTQEAEYEIQRSFLLLLFLLYIALTEPLAIMYHRYSESHVFKNWWENINNIVPKLLELFDEFDKEQLPSEIDDKLEKLVGKKLRIEKFKE